MKKSLQMFLIMFKIGIFTFGGGYAMIPLIENEFVTKRAWMTHDEFVNMLAIAESSPGPIAINSATYLGYKQGKFIGALMATLGVVMPSVLIITLIAMFFNNILEYPIVAAAFKGIQVCVVFLILIAGLKMFKKLEKSIFNYIVFAIVFVCVILLNLFAINFSTIYYILIFALISLMINLITRLKHSKGKEGGENNDIS